MRDIVFLIFSVYLIYLAFRRPYVAVSLWLWIGLFVPVHWLYGIAQSISFNSIFAFIAIVGYFFQVKKQAMSLNFSFLFVLIFWVHTLITSAATLGISELVWFEWVKLSKIMLLLIMIVLCIREKYEFELLCWIAILSIGFYGSVEGLKFIISGGGHKIAGPQGHLLSDNNHFAVALCMLIPIILFMFQACSEKWLKIGLVGVLCLCVIAVIGTHSRGGFIGLLVVSGYYWLKSNHKLVTTTGLLIAVALGSLFLPQNWHDRMNTIETATQDSSFTTRLTSWKVHTLLAMGRPLLGGGFKTGSYGYIWKDMVQDFDKLDFIKTSPPGDKGWAAHSIYFQVLGDHGFLGLTLYLVVMITCFLRLGWVNSRMKTVDEKYRWRADLARMLQLSLIAFGTAGAAVSLAYLEFYWALIGISISLIVSTQQLLAQSRLEPSTDRGR